LCDISSYTCDKNIISCSCGQIPVGVNVQIVNSEDAISYSWPMMVSLHLNNRHTCSRTILSDSFILTSFECVSFFHYDYDITIVVGIHRLSETVTVSRKVDGIYLHASYSSA